MKRILCLFPVWLVACGESETSSLEPIGSAAGDDAPASSSGDPSDEPEPPRADLGVQPPTSCEAACDAASGCQGSLASDCLLQCATELDAAYAIGEACGTATENLETCVGGLSCDALNEHDGGGDSPCRDAEQEAAVACGSSTGEPSSVCEDVCAVVDACGISDPAECLAGCVQVQAAALEVGEACATAQDEQLTCATGLDCADLETWLSTGAVAGCPNPEDACLGE